MPWLCPNPACGASVALDSDKACPACGAGKPAWSVAADVTRSLVVALKKKVECRRGRSLPTRSGAPSTHTGVAWLATREASVITKAEARRLSSRGLLPEPFDLLHVRLRPPRTGRWTLKVSTLFDRSKPAEQELEFEADPDTLGDGGFFAAHFLCVHGPGGLDGIAFPFIHLLDVTEEETPDGHAPRLEVSGLRGKAIPIDLVQHTTGPKTRLEVRRGALLETTADSPAQHLGTSWKETTVGSAVPKHEALTRRRGRLTPDPSDQLRVRVFPPAGAADATVAITVQFESKPAETFELAFTVDALDEDGAFAVDVVCVFGPESIAGLRFPFINVLDVSDFTTGHAPRLEVRSGDAEPIVITLEADPGEVPPRKVTYQVRGQIYNRLLFVEEPPDIYIADQKQVLPDNPPDPHAKINTAKPVRTTLPASLSNRFSRNARFQTDCLDYAMARVQLELRQGTRSIISGVSDEDGSFILFAQLDLKTRYTLVATLNPQGRAHPERILIPFQVDEVPEDFTAHSEPIEVEARHEVNTASATGGESWQLVEKEPMVPRIKGGSAQPVLFFSGPGGALVFDTFALDVGWISQRLEAPDGSVRFATFTLDGATFGVQLEHLCLATCMAMVLQHHGRFAGMPGKDVVERLAVAAGLFYMQTGRFDPPPTNEHSGQPMLLDETKTDPAGNQLVQLDDGTFPHNHTFWMLPGARDLMLETPPKEGTPPTRGRGHHLQTHRRQDLVNSFWPRLTNLLSLGLLPVLADDLEGSWEHARVCHGFVLRSDGTFFLVYVNDPNDEDKWTIKTDGSESDLGWTLLGRTLDQSEISGASNPLECGGDTPAPLRGASVLDR